MKSQKRVKNSSKEDYPARKGEKSSGRKKERIAEKKKPPGSEPQKNLDVPQVERKRGKSATQKKKRGIVGKEKRKRK